MLQRLLDVIGFAIASFALWGLLTFVLVGVTCFRHGDVGPYPELDWEPWVAPIAMLIVYTVRRK
jgi:hypothetical protein